MRGRGRSTGRALGTQTVGRRSRENRQSISRASVGGEKPVQCVLPSMGNTGRGRVLPRAGKASPGTLRLGTLQEEFQRPLADKRSRHGEKNTWFGDQLGRGRCWIRSAAVSRIASRSHSLPRSGVLLLPRVSLLSLVPEQPDEKRSGQTPSDQQGRPNGAHG